MLRRFADKAPYINGIQKYPPRLIHHRPATRCYTSNVSFLTKEREMFRDVLPRIIDALVKNPKFNAVPKMGTWIQKLMNHTLTGGRGYRGLMVVHAYKSVERPENITRESLMMARTLGWCVEIQLAYFLILDDLLDGSSTRRGKPCWYTLPEVGKGAVKDALIMHSFVNEILKENCSRAPLYAEIVDLFNETVLYSAIGEHLGLIVLDRHKSDYSQFTMEQFITTARYKTGYHSYKLPILLGYLLANNSNKNLQRNVEDVCFELGTLHQIQNDMLDCYGDESLTGKAGNDIQEGKCSWLAVNALKLSNDAQRAVFTENYADKDPARVKNIKRLFEELKLRELYSKEEKALCKSIQLKASALPEGDGKMLVMLLELAKEKSKDLRKGIESL